MKQDKRTQNGFLDSLIGERTPAKTSGLVYTVSACAFFFVSYVVSMFSQGEEKPQWFLYLTFLAAPIAFALVVGWYFAYTKTPVKDFFRAQRCHPKYYLLALTVQIGLLSLGELNGVFLRFLERFGYEDSEIILPSLNGFGFVGVLFAVAVLPAVMEELFFRGVFLREMKEFSPVMQVVLCGGLFALYHQNPAQTVYQFICGVAFALVAMRAGSFLPTVLAHFINNAFIITLYKLGITSYPLPMYVIMLVLSVLCLVGSAVYIFVFDKGTEPKSPPKKGAYGSFFACAAIGIFVFALSWLLTLVTGFSGF